jgi:hypothetical protein
VETAVVQENIRELEGLVEGPIAVVLQLSTAKRTNVKGRCQAAENKVSDLPRDDHDTELKFTDYDISVLLRSALLGNTIISSTLTLAASSFCSRPSDGHRAFDSAQRTQQLFDISHLKPKVQIDAALQI